ncbi:dihydropteroate synthase [Candidatus Woesearchaeota archaeon]|nr:dihydropteroate synthase [Candidatus Woesearchaeota archaeon]
MTADFGFTPDRRKRIATALRFDGAPQIMGIVNATDDSFFEGSRTTGEGAVARGLSMWDAGATWVDVGGESTRPGAQPVSIATEKQRVVPVIRGLRKARPEGLISVDTRHAEVALAALEAGADLVNDVSGLREPAMVDVVLRTGCGVCIMHMQGEPGSMQANPTYANVVKEVGTMLEQVKRHLVDEGHPEELICVDPGIGFGKTQDHNIALLRSGRQLLSSEGSLLWGVSRKSVVGHLTGHTHPEDRLAGTLGLAALAHRMQIDVLRVHDVEEHADLFATMRIVST